MEAALSTTCDVCNEKTVQERLSCQHGFCSSCFEKYLHGSIDELNRYVRCCVCGSITKLTFEKKREDVRFRFGRDCHPKLQHVTGVAQRQNGDYVFVDPPKKRVLVFNKRGELSKDFAYLYNYDIMYGITVDKKDRLIFPTLTKDSTNPFNTQRHVGLAYYNFNGCPIGFAFLDPTSEVSDVVVTPENKLIVADIANSKLWYIHEKQRVICSNVLEPLIGEQEVPKPTGLAVDKVGCYYLCDGANHSVKVYYPSGELKFSFGSEGQQPGEFNYPTAVAVDEEGRIIVADKHNHRVQLFTDEGIFERFIVRYNQGEDVYMLPVGLSYLGNGEVAVLLRGEKDALVSEIRAYPCEGPPDVLSC